MALKPVLKLKVDELFLRWLSDPDTQHLLRSNLRQIQTGEPLVYHPQPHRHAGSSSNSRGDRRPGSPSTPPCSPTPSKVPTSPRSPRVRSEGWRSKNQKAAAAAAAEKEASPLLQKHAEKKERSEEDSRFLSNKKAPAAAAAAKKSARTDSDPSNRSSNNSSSDSISDGSKLISSPHTPATQTSLSKGAKKAAAVGADNTRTNKASPVPVAAVTPNVHIPPFYFPHGRPIKQAESDAVYKNIKEAFAKFESQRATKANMLALVKALGLPCYWKSLLFIYAGGEKNGYVSLQSFLAAWRKLTSQCHDDATRFVKISAKPGCNYLEEDDFIPLIQDVVENHPGLSFLHEAPEFHSRYVQTVISRILYCVNRSWSGRITVGEIRKSNLLQTIKLLEDEEDINQINDFFSYEHFYVIYCKFWELDKDHDLYISSEDLLRHNDEAISSRMIERIFSGAVTKNLKDGKMSYKDFVWFLISEEDKRHPTSIEYWFRCMDLDGDGVISMYEMQYFYEEQVKKMQALGIDTLPFEDCLCMMLDMIAPQRRDCISLADLKACKLTPIFFDTFFNLDKYLEHEQKDPFANVRDHDSEEPEPTDWERFAAEEYDNLVSEEGANDMQEEILYEDDFEPDEEPLPKEAAVAAAGKQQDPAGKSRPSDKDDDDIYDFSHAKESF